MSALERIRAARLAESLRAQREQAAADAAALDAEHAKALADCDDCGQTLTTPDAVALPDGPITASAVAVRDAVVYPASHFEKWDADGKDQTPLTFTPEGRVFGHLAGTGCYDNGNTSTCYRYTRDPDPQLRRFHTWTTTLDNGEVIRTGAITAEANHADATTLRTEAENRAYHENTSTVIARVVAWEDRRGRLAATGSVVPGLPASVLGRTAGAPVSIELWPTVETGGRRTLLAAHMVVTPAWPVQ